MGYYGHVQCICKNGHYFEEEDGYYFEAECPICKAETGWENHVDDTNGESVGIIPKELLEEKFLISPEQREVCNLGHEHILAHKLFRIPSFEETRELQYRRNGKGDLVKFKPLYYGF